MTYATRRPVAFTLSMGVLGAAALIVTAWNTVRGPRVLIPYAVILLVTALYLYIERVPRFMSRFGMCLGVFVVSSMFYYLFIGVVAAKTLLIISLTGHAWRVGLILLIGVVLSGAVAQLTATKIRK